MVTRPDPQAASLCDLIKKYGGRAVHFPTIAFAPPQDLNAFQQAIPMLGEQEWLIFNSPRAVYSSVVSIRRAWPQLPQEVKFAAVGGGTAKVLRQAGYEVAVHPTTEWSSEALLALPEFQSIVGKKIAIIRGAGGREWLDKTLVERGAQVLQVIAYERVLPQVMIDDVLQLLKHHKIDIIVCTSFEGVKNLKILLGDTAWPYLKECRLIVVSERIKRLAQDLGFQTIWIARNASDTAILEAIVIPGH